MAGCSPARHGEQQHLSRSAGAGAGAHPRSQGPFAAKALPGQLKPNDAAPALKPPPSLSPLHPSSLLLGYTPACPVSVPHLQQEGLSQAGSVPSCSCRAGLRPVAVVLLHPGAQARTGAVALPCLPCHARERPVPT